MNVGVALMAGGDEVLPDVHSQRAAHAAAENVVRLGRPGKPANLAHATRAENIQQNLVNDHQSIHSSLLGNSSVLENSSV